VSHLHFFKQSNEIVIVSGRPSQKLAVRVALFSLEFLQAVADRLGCQLNALNREKWVEGAKQFEAN
jgi:hypothetical protein